MIKGITAAERSRTGIPADVTGMYVRRLDWNEREKKIFHDQFVRGANITDIQVSCFPYRSTASLYGYKYCSTGLPKKTAKQNWHPEEINALVVVANAMGNTMLDTHGGVRFDVPLKIADKARWYVSRAGGDTIIGNKTPYNVLTKIYELGLQTSVGRRKASERVGIETIRMEADAAALAKEKRGKVGRRR